MKDIQNNKIYRQKKIIVFIICVFFFSVSFCQTKCELLNNYFLASCKKDTATALRNLEEFRNLYPRDSLIEEIDLRTAGLYLGTGDFPKSKEISWGIVYKKRKNQLGVT